MNRIKSIRLRLVLAILPIVFIALNTISFITNNIGKNAVISQADERMVSTATEYANSISSNLESLKSTAISVSNAISAGYKTVDGDYFAKLCSQTALSNEMILGSGIWFEPGVYNEEEKYYGPYWYKELDSDGNATGKIIEEWGYSNAEYDYFNQEYYINAKSIAKGEAMITDPYYDPTSGLIMATCSAPIYDGDKYIGCVTVDLMLTSFVNMLSNIKIGDSGTIWLIDSAGNYIFHPAVETAAADGLNIESSTEMSDYIDKIKNENEGVHCPFTWEKKTRLLYWTTVPGTEWKIGLTIEENELLADINRMTKIAIVITIIAILVNALVIIMEAISMSNSMKKVQKFAETLADCDFTVDEVEIKRKDEIGAMAIALNKMYNNNSDVIKNIGDGSSRVSNSSEELANTSNVLLEKFNAVASAMEKVNDAMTSTGAATEEVSASANEVNSQVEGLSEETRKTKDEVVIISQKAAKIEKESKESAEKAIKIAEQHSIELQNATEQAKVIDEISVFADTISEIAGRINLLSLNASIEAARAGEHGRGFSVVAGEINNLAAQTKESVEHIQETITHIQEAFSALQKSATDLLEFTQNTVTPDYEKFIDIGQSYGNDAKTFGELADKISEMVNYISESMNQVNAAVSEIAESATDTASSSADVEETISESAKMMENVNQMVHEQQNVSNELDTIVNKFKLS